MTRENYTLLWRLLAAGAVEAEVNIESSFSGKPVELYNTVAEIAGTEKPDEVVIVGGHLDSWIWEPARRTMVRARWPCWKPRGRCKSWA